MTLYSKTLAGRIASVDQQSTLAPVLKDFLRSVDGKTPPDQLAARWRDEPAAMQLLQELEQKGLIEVRAVRWRNSAANSAFPSSFDDISPSGFALPQAAAGASPAATQTRPSAELDTIKDHMATFVLTHLPQHAMTALKDIEAVDSDDQLMLMLTAYANLAHEAGRTGLAHIKSLRAMLEPGFQATAH